MFEKASGGPRLQEGSRGKMRGDSLRKKQSGSDRKDL